MGTVLTLPDMHRARPDAVDGGVIDTIVRDFPALNVIPFETLPTVEIVHRRKNYVTTVDWRAGRGAPLGKLEGGSEDEIRDAVYQLGGTIGLDKIDIRDKRADATGLVMERLRDGIRGMAWTFKDALINGDHAVSPDMFEGLKVRIAMSGSGQTVYAKSASSPLDVTPGTATNADLYQWMDQIDRAIDACDGETADIALCNREFIQTFRSMLRRLGLYTHQDASKPTTAVSPKRTSSIENTGPQLVYRDVKFYVTGLRADQVNRVITPDTIGGAPCEPVYFVKLGKDYFHGIQLYPPEITKPERNDDLMTHTAAVDWTPGVHHAHPRSFSVLRGSQVAA